MCPYYVEVDVMQPMGCIIANKRYLIQAHDPMEAPRKVFLSIKSEFGNKRMVKVCRKCEELT